MSEEEAEEEEEEEAEPIYCSICQDEEDEDDLYSCDACDNRVCDDCYNFNMSECNDCGTVTCSDCGETLDRDATHFCESCHKDVCYSCYGSDNTCKDCQWDVVGTYVHQFLHKRSKTGVYTEFMKYLKNDFDPYELLLDEDEDEEEALQDLHDELDGLFLHFTNDVSTPENNSPIEGKIVWVGSPQ